ncbi:hypothetical protein ACFE04_015080 [Oxalis oulophora]
MATLTSSLACLMCGATTATTTHLSDKSKLFSSSERIDAVQKQLTHEHNRRFGVRLLATPRVNAAANVSTMRNQVDELKKVATYLFQTQVGGQVKVFVGKNNGKYIVNIDVTSLSNGCSKLMLVWCKKRSESRLAQDAMNGTLETEFIQTFDKFSLELLLEDKQTPFYFSFLLKSFGADSAGLDIRSHYKTDFCVPLGFSSGSPAPLGFSFSTDGSLNFAIISRNAKNVVLCLYDNSDIYKPTLEIDLDPNLNRSGDVWHVSLENTSNFLSYGYRFQMVENEGNRTEQVLLDPYAKILESFTTDNQDSRFITNYLGKLCKEPAFDWSGDVRLNLPMEKLVVYRLNVKRFTEHKSSKLSAGVAGTFTGLSKKVYHLKDLGVNAVLLEPIFPFHEKSGPYHPCHIFSPNGLSGDVFSTINSMKEMVKTMHANGIEVLLEVVFTGTIHGIDDLSYFCKNVENLEENSDSSLNCNHPVVQQMILDSLRYWVTEFHIDGFCFMNASSMLRGFLGEYLSRPPLIEAITFDPVLSKTKIIADFWDPHNMETNETKFPHWKRWAEVNTKYCDDVRNFLRGKALLSDLATRLCGSGDIFSDGRGPAFSFNFISRNFGLSLVDLVSFSKSTELASELSWNCGEEGATRKTAVLEKRLKQIRNFLFILFVSLGVPIINMGDDCGQSTGGSVLYSDRKNFDWNVLESSFGVQITQFISFFSSFRIKRSDLLQSRDFLKGENIDWYSSDLSPPEWDNPSCKFLAMTLRAERNENDSDLSSESTGKGDLFIAINAADHSGSITLPTPPAGMIWHRLVDTARPFPGFFSTDGVPVKEKIDDLFTYQMKSHSCALFEATHKL